MSISVGMTYRERAAKIAYKLAAQRSLQPLEGCAGRAPGEHGNRNSGPLTLPGWGRPGSEQKRKRNAEEDPDSEQRASPPPPLPPMPKAVSVTSLSELVESLTSARSSPSLSSSSGGEGVENAPGVENEQAQAHDSHCEELKIRGHQEEEKVATSIEVTSGEAEKRELSVEAAPNVNKISASLGRSSSVFNA